MNQKNQIHLYGEGQPSPVIIEVSEQATLAELLSAAQCAGVLAGDVSLKEVLVFVLDEEEPLGHDKPVVRSDKRQKFHCHRCRKVQVSVTFNLDTKSHGFAPSTLVSKVLKWALQEFKLKGADAQNKELRLGGQNGQVLLDDAPIGSYIRHPHCDLLVYLVDAVQVQG
ncbi:MAG TPA: hypothetical protein VNW30_09185 [Opitutaceae bacterium]|jgi:hypothetical protein|nr:hypothetical protein [Opitutaceae bacterium]